MTRGEGWPARPGGLNRKDPWLLARGLFVLLVRPAERSHPVLGSDGRREHEGEKRGGWLGLVVLLLRVASYHGATL